jgi:hypothetical protein
MSTKNTKTQDIPIKNISNEDIMTKNITKTKALKT